MAEKGQAEYRKKLRERFLSGEMDTRSDEMLLELLLTQSREYQKVAFLNHLQGWWQKPCGLSVFRMSLRTYGRIFSQMICKTLPSGTHPPSL